jgi:dihydroorotate dehydrogenase electron transfer subunit
MSYITGVIERIRNLTKSIKEYEIFLEDCIKPEPGQFVMLWIPRIGEIPLSFADAEDNIIRFIVARVGRVTGYMHERLMAGDKVFIRGPLGRGFRWAPSGRALLVAGGYGLAPLHFLAKKLRAAGCGVKALLGFKSDDDVFYREEFERLGEVEISVEHGSSGYRGTVLDLFRNVIQGEIYDMVYVCGKEELNLAVMRECLIAGLPVEASFERRIRCGAGICGSCSIEPLGLRVCKDGPIFDGRMIMPMLGADED